MRAGSTVIRSNAMDALYCPLPARSTPLGSRSTGPTRRSRLTYLTVPRRRPAPAAHPARAARPVGRGRSRASAGGAVHRSARRRAQPSGDRPVGAGDDVSRALPVHSRVGTSVARAPRRRPRHPRSRLALAAGRAPRPGDATPPRAAGAHRRAPGRGRGAVVTARGGQPAARHRGGHGATRSRGGVNATSRTSSPCSGSCHSGQRLVSAGGLEPPRTEVHMALNHFLPMLRSVRS